MENKSVWLTIFSFVLYTLYFHFDLGPSEHTTKSGSKTAGLAPLHPIRIPPPYHFGEIKLLVSLVSFSTAHIEHVNTIFKNCRDICEGGINVTVHVHTAAPVDRYRMLSESGMMWCDRFKRSVFVDVISYSKSVGKTLPCVARSYTWAYRDDYNWFLQTEDDVDIRLSTLLEYWYVHSVTSEFSQGNFKPGWVMYDRDDEFLVITQMGSANSTAKMHSQLYQDKRGAFWFSIPSYMCGFFLDKKELVGLGIEGRFEVDTGPDGEFSKFPWKMEYCNGMGLKENRLIPLHSWGRLMVNHLTNKYASDGRIGLRVKARDFLSQWGFEYDADADRFNPVDPTLHSNPIALT